MACGLSHFALATCNKVLTLRRKKRLVADYFVVRLNLLTDLPSQVRSLQMRIPKSSILTDTVKTLHKKLIGADSNLQG